MKKHILSTLLALSITACGGGSGGDGTGDSDNNNQNPNDNIPNANVVSNIFNYDTTFEELDNYLASKSGLSTESVDGLWIFYARGTNNFSDTINGGLSSTNAKRTPISAVVGNIREVNEDGLLMLALGDCSLVSSQYIYTTTTSHTLVDYDKNNSRFAISWRDLISTFSSAYGLSDISHALTHEYTFSPSDYTETLVDVQIVDNQEMLFNQRFQYVGSYQKDPQSQGGGYDSRTVNIDFEIKARKISDDVTDSLGELIIGADSRDAHCFELETTENDVEQRNNGALTAEVGELSFTYAVSSYPSIDDGISSFLYSLSSSTTVVQGNGGTMTWEDVRLDNTSDQFNLNAGTYAPNDVVDVTTSISNGLNTEVSYSLYESLDQESLAGSISISF